MVKTTRERVIAILNKRDTGMTPAEIAKAAKIDHANARQLLRRMLDYGDAEYDCGRYYRRGYHYGHPGMLPDDYSASMRVTEVLRRLKREGRRLTDIIEGAKSAIAEFAEEEGLSQ
jgi:methylphosphotriester-DNA--protein-cysteine methyltransferase